MFNLGIQTEDYFITPLQVQSDYSYSFTGLTLGLNYPIRFDWGSIEPYISAGGLWFGVDYLNRWHAKKAGENYFKDITLNFDSKRHFNKVITPGITVKYDALKNFGMSLTFEYLLSRLKNRYLVSSVDLLDATDSFGVNTSLTATSVNFYLGLYMRF